MNIEYEYRSENTPAYSFCSLLPCTTVSVNEGTFNKADISFISDFQALVNDFGVPVMFRLL